MVAMGDELHCMGHLNRFEHLSVPNGEIERQFDVGYKFEVRESDEYSVDPRTGVKAWAEPFLALYLSFTRWKAPHGQYPLRYGLTRSRWQTPGQPSDEDRQELLGLAITRIPEDLVHAQSPETSDVGFRML